TRAPLRARSRATRRSSELGRVLPRVLGDAARRHGNLHHCQAPAKRAARGGQMSNTTAVAGQSLTITRRLRRTPDEIFDAWLDADGMRTWMVGVTLGEAHATIDARVGGKFRIDMIKADQSSFEHTGEYLTIDRPRKLSFTWISGATNHL